MEMDWARARRTAGNDSMARLLADNEGNMAADRSRPDASECRQSKKKTRTAESKVKTSNQ
jgi:hypothetical protein